MYMDEGDYRQAELFLERVERIDPDAPFIPMARELLRLERQNPQLKKPNKPFSLPPW